MAKNNPMTDEQEALFTDVFHATTELVDSLKDEADENGGRLPCREFSLAFTKLEEAEMWLRRGFEEMEYEVPEPEDDEGEEEGDAPEEPEDKAEEEE